MVMYQLPELMTLLKGYLDNLHSAKQELSLAFTNEAFTHLVQVTVDTSGMSCLLMLMDSLLMYRSVYWRGRIRVSMPSLKLEKM